VSDQDFTFTITLSSRDAFKELVGELAASVLRQVGCGPPVVTGLLDDLAAALEPHVRGTEPFDVQFHVVQGRCDVIVRQGGQERWRTSREIP
jgi:hypothetical protein